MTCICKAIAVYVLHFLHNFYALFYRIPLNRLAHPSRADDIERVEMCVWVFVVSHFEFCHGQMESSSFGFRFFPHFYNNE